jgi:hypothetical protein
VGDTAVTPARWLEHVVEAIKQEQDVLGIAAPEVSEVIVGGPTDREAGLLTSGSGKVRPRAPASPSERERTSSDQRGRAGALTVQDF